MNSEPRYYLYTMASPAGALQVVFSVHGLHLLHCPDFARHALMRQRLTAACIAAESDTAPGAVQVSIPAAVAAWAEQLRAALSAASPGQSFTAAAFYRSCASIPLCHRPFVSAAALPVLHCLVQWSRRAPERTLSYAQLGRLVAADTVQPQKSDAPGMPLLLDLNDSHCPVPSSPETGGAVHARAVASALKANPILLIIPCHMVIPAHASGHEVGGFVLGTECKRQLLDLWQARLPGAGQLLPDLQDDGPHAL